jgi:hypothetical protein
MAETHPGAAALRRVQDAAKDAVERAAHDLLARAIPLTPMEEATLRQSGHVEEPVIQGNRISVAVSFNTPYAAAQHEGHAIRTTVGKSAGPLQVVHVTHWRARQYTTPGTGPKYLERPLKEMAATYRAAIAASVRAALRG